ncbi:hypothetical protein EJD97_022311, partial [Solanum chilense]
QRQERPNILITGTPGTGKTTTAAALAEVTELRHINVGDFANEENLTNGWDDTFDCYYINEDLVCDALENLMEEGGNIVDHHACDFFPECCFDCVVVLQTDSSVLHERFTKRYSNQLILTFLFVCISSIALLNMSRLFDCPRGYSDHKLATNTECQIFQVLLDEVKENYPDDILVILRSDFLEDITKNVETLTSWISNLSSAV